MIQFQTMRVQPIPAPVITQTLPDPLRPARGGDPPAGAICLGFQLHFPRSMLSRRISPCRPSINPSGVSARCGISPPPAWPTARCAAFLVSEALGWQLVPPTVYRRKGPFGKGSLQLFIPHDPNQHYFNFSDAEKESAAKLSPASTCWSTTPTARAATSSGRGRAPVGRSTTASASTGNISCAR